LSFFGLHWILSSWFFEDRDDVVSESLKESVVAGSSETVVPGQSETVVPRPSETVVAGTSESVDVVSVELDVDNDGKKAGDAGENLCH
jgi:hypothetical protein